MSYAAIAAKNAPPEEEQPHPSQDLLEGHFEGETKASNVLDDTHKVEVLERDWKNHPETTTTTHEPSPAPTNPISNSTPSPLDPLNTTPHTSSSAPTPPPPSKPTMDSQLNAANQPPAGSEVQLPSAKEVGEKVDRGVEKGREKVEEGERKVKAEGRKAEQKGREVVDEAERKGKEFERKAKAELQQAENALSKYYAQAKDIVLRPGTLGGIMGVANVGLLGTLGYYAYTRRNLPVWNRNYVGGAVASVVALFGIEGIVADQYASTPEGRYEIERAKEEGSKVYVNAREVVLRPGVAGGLLGAVNVAVLGAVGYLGYQNWDRPVWDRKLVAGITCGLISLSAVEGLAGSVYKQKELPRQKRKGNA